VRCAGTPAPLRQPRPARSGTSRMSRRAPERRARRPRDAPERRTCRVRLRPRRDVGRSHRRDAGHPRSHQAHPAPGGDTVIAAAFAPTIPTIGGILAAMALLALIETAVPLHARGRWNRFHVQPNVALTLLTFATNMFLNAALVMTLFWLEAKDFGLLRMVSLQPLTTSVIAVLVLDFSFYVAHVAMHTVPGFWRFHRVHHADPAV